MNRKISKIAIVAIASAISLTACSPKSMKWECPSLPKANNQDQESDPTDPTTVKIQFDGTPSMQGFVNTKSSRYVQTLDLLDRAAQSAFSKPRIKYYRFGLTREELSGEQSSQKAQSPNFYDIKNLKLLDASLNVVLKPIDNNSSDEISIIVTDLYQKQSSRESPVITLIRDSYIQKGKAVGILAVKSEFTGKIYDVGKEDKSFEWNANINNSKKFHPFYVIVLGSYRNISHYFDQLKNNNSILKNENFIIFYPQLLEKSLVLNINASDNTNLPKGIQRLPSINNGKVLLKLENPDLTNVDILKIRNEYNGKQGIPYIVNYLPLPYTLPIELKAKPNISQIFKEENKDFINTTSDLELLKLNNWKPEPDNKVSFVAEVNSLKETGVYKFAVDVLPKNLKEQDWWKVWSFDEDEAASWSKKPDQFDGSRTYNLLPFLQELSNITLRQVELSKSPIGRFCYVLQKE